MVINFKVYIQSSSKGMDDREKKVEDRNAKLSKRKELFR